MKTPETILSETYGTKPSYNRKQVLSAMAEYGKQFSAKIRELEKQLETANSYGFDE